ncbi:MAG: aldose 1-epimerase [Lentisphaerae bacterium]|nr:aldose 1-epimerase [Lentisphaerota bacterium]
MSNVEKIDLELGGFAVSFRPQLGANMVRLLHKESGLEILRTPPDDATYRTKPEIWGMPVLMPPNRIRDGRFVYQQREYQLPVNEPMPRHTCLHGIILHKAWEFNQLSSNCVEMHISYPGTAANEGWMHTFEANLQYKFSSDQVEQQLVFTNTSDLTMPLMVGFHSAFNFPDKAEFYLDADNVNRTLDDLRKIVDGKSETVPDWQRFRSLQHGERVLGHFAMKRNDKTNAELLIRYPQQPWQMRYQLPEPWREWVIWNNLGTENFICVEPQSCRIDAMNIGLPLQEAGVIELLPGAAQAFKSSIVIEKI